MFLFSIRRAPLGALGRGFQQVPAPRRLAGRVSPDRFEPVIPKFDDSAGVPMRGPSRSFERSERFRRSGAFSFWHVAGLSGAIA